MPFTVSVKYSRRSCLAMTNTEKCKVKGLEIVSVECP